MSLPVGSLVLPVSPGTRGLPSHVVGGEGSSQPVRLRSLVPDGAGVLHQPSGTLRYSSRVAPLPSFSVGSACQGVFKQHHSPVLYSETGGHVFGSTEPQSSPSSLDGVAGHYSSAPVHHGGMECNGGFPESSRPGDWFQVDPSSGGG